MSKTSSTPKVSIVIPCRNEEAYIGRCVQSFLDNDYPRECMQIIIVDGQSSDDTLKLIMEITESYPETVELIQNPKKTTPHALNLGVTLATGDYVFIMSAHAEVSKNYIAGCIHYHLLGEAENVGGLMRTCPQTDSVVGQAIVECMSHPLGVGNARFRSGVKEPTLVDTVFGGSYHRRIFEHLNGFNNALIRLQDLDFNHRLRKQGGRVLLIPDVESNYFTRSTLKSFIVDNIRAGHWAMKARTLTESTPVTFRHLAPALFVLMFLTLMVLGLLSSTFFIILLFAVVGYGSLLLGASVVRAFSKRNVMLVLWMPVIFVVRHACYGIGSLYGLKDIIICISQDSKRVNR